MQVSGVEAFGLFMAALMLPPAIGMALWAFLDTRSRSRAQREWEEGQSSSVPAE